MCTMAIQINHLLTLQVRSPTQWFKGYTQIMILLFSFLFERFGFNLLVVIYGMFNFLVFESEWTSQRA